MELRDYQRAAVEAAKEWACQSLEPCLVELATGAGKSIICAELAGWLNQVSQKPVLCLAPSKELVEQNHQKFVATGHSASIWCASISKSLKHPVVFGSPQSVKTGLKKFRGAWGGVILDEAHKITPSIKAIIDQLREQNPKLRVIGMTATPYRLGTGYIYQYDEQGQPVPDDQTREPYFHSLVYRVPADYLIEQGYLTPPHADPHHVESYDTSGLSVSRMGKFDAKAVEQAFEGHGRKTAAIVADIVSHSVGRKGVMIFAATREHAAEVLASLPPDISASVDGGTPKPERESILARFKAQRIKYIVNVAVLTTGFDAPHVDVVAILRATESVSLLQQIIGRGLRLGDPTTAGNPEAIAHGSKPDCLVLDYAENIERHCPGGDIFDPEIKAGPPKGNAPPVKAKCLSCGVVNEFSARPNPEEFEIDAEGYFRDLAGNRIMVDDQPMPAHFGRRCFGFAMVAGRSERCPARWSHKACPECDAENDIAARRCTSCKAELVDPNEKLRLDFTKMKKSPSAESSDKVLAWRPQQWASSNGNQTLRVDYTTEFRTFPVWYMPESGLHTNRAQWADFVAATLPGGEQPSTPAEYMRLHQDAATRKPLTVRSFKDRKSGFFRVTGHNTPEDVAPVQSV